MGRLFRAFRRGSPKSTPKGHDGLPSRPATPRLAPTVGGIAFEGGRYLILLACDEYQKMPTLRCPRRDASAIRNVMTTAIGGFEIASDIVHGQNRDDALAQLQAGFGASTADNDVVLFYFSGHGVIDSHGGLRLALGATDENHLDATAVALSELLTLAEESAAGTVVLVLDCCYSGSIADVIPRPDVNRPFVGVSTGQTLHVLTSSTAVQQSWEKEGEDTSVFTQFFVTGLETGRADRDNDGVVTVEEAYSYAKNLMAAAGRQNPLRFNYNVRNDLVLTRNPQFRPLDPLKITASKMALFQAIRTMVDIVRKEEGEAYENMTRFGVMILGDYYIEGIPVGASMLSVSPTHTPNIVQTQDGFECDAFFPPDLLTSAMKNGKEEISGRYKVRMKLLSDSILAIVGKRASDPDQFNLYTGGQSD